MVTTNKLFLNDSKDVIWSSNPGVGGETTMAVSEGLKPLAGYLLQLIKANFIASDNCDLRSLLDSL